MAQREAEARVKTPFVSVAVRIRPALCAEPATLWRDANRVCCHRGYLLEEYDFSRVFGPEDENRQLFGELQGPALTESVFSGVNETLFAYGQTGSGKTHTIFGSAGEPGLLELFVRQIFQKASQDPEISVHLCCYEVLGDALTDLVDSTSLLAEGRLQQEDIVYDELFIKTQRCRYQICHVRSVEHCLALLHLARKKRTSGMSSQNADSSRSHAIVHLFVQTPQRSSTAIGTLTLVDLAGTEKEHENPTELGRKSARLLNTSLCSLNRLLRKLQGGCLDESERRQSVLNKCLWEYLRPGCGIALVFCVSPLFQHRSASLSTLGMATDSKAIHSQRKSQYIPVSPRQAGQAQDRCASPGPRAPRTPRRPVGVAVEEEPVGTPRDASNFRRKLERNARRCERLRQEVERAHEELSNDNQTLKRECESLRELFIRQQKQQIAFWTGPFLDMVGEKPGAESMAKLGVSHAKEAIAAVRKGAEETSPRFHVPHQLPLGPAGQQESLETLRSEVDYWRQMAMSLQRQLQKPGRRSSKATPETCSSSRRSESEERNEGLDTTSCSKDQVDVPRPGVRRETEFD